MKAVTADGAFCLARDTQSTGFYCVLRKHDDEHPHVTVDNGLLDEHGRPGRTVRWFTKVQDGGLLPGREARPMVARAISIDLVVDKAPALNAEYIERIARENARASGFTGDPCGNCGALKLVVNGSCLRCADCGTTTGCS